MESIPFAKFYASFPSLAILSALVLPLILLYTLWTCLVYPLLFSPLRRIPAAHPSAPFSSLWINYVRHQSLENQTLLKAHQRLGEVICLSPSELSVNCVDNGLRTIYAGGFEKPSWYPNLFSNYDGVHNMFSTAESGPHSGRKKMISNVYAKSSVQTSPTMALVARNIVYGRLLPLLQVKERMGAALNIRRLIESTSMDMVTGYMFGFRNSSNFLKNPQEAEWWLSRYQSRKRFTFWPQEMPRLTDILSTVGISLSPKWVADANHDLEGWCLQLCDGAEDTVLQLEKQHDSQANVPDDQPAVYAQLQSQLRKESQKSSTIPISNAPQRLQIASELLDHLSAGHETSAITLTFLFYELSRRPSLQRRLRTELHTLQPQISLPTSSSNIRDFPSAKSIDTLPLLHAIVMETLRRHPAIPGPQPRVTPVARRPGENKIGSFTHIPAGVRVSANAYCLHNNADLFPEPSTWIPERWLDPFTYPDHAPEILQFRPEGQKPRKTPQEEDEVSREMHRWFWAFGSGGRMCVGKNLAILQMKAIVASVVSCFRVELTGLDEEEVGEGLYEGVWGERWEGREPLETPELGQEDAYTAQPSAERVNVRLKRWDEERYDSTTDDEM